MGTMPELFRLHDEDGLAETVDDGQGGSVLDIAMACRHRGDQGELLIGPRRRVVAGASLPGLRCVSRVRPAGY